MEGTAPGRARGKHIGALLLDTVVGDSIGVVRLSVWKWRSSAIDLYLSRGFSEVASWDARPELVCMEFVRAQRAATASL